MFGDGSIRRLSEWPLALDARRIARLHPPKFAGEVAEKPLNARFSAL